MSRRPQGLVKRLGTAMVIALVAALAPFAPAQADNQPPPPGTTPGEPVPVDGGDGTIGTTYTCTPELDIKAVPTLHERKEGYTFQIILDRATCPAVDLDNKHFGFTCHIRFYPDGSGSYSDSADVGLNSIAAGDPDLLICETWVSKAFLANAESSWTVRAWASMKDHYPESVHINDMYRERTFNVRDDGTIIYRIPAVLPG